MAGRPLRSLRNGRPPRVPELWVSGVQRALGRLKEGCSVSLDLIESPYGMRDVRVKVTRGPQGDIAGKFSRPRSFGLLPELTFYGKVHGGTEETIRHELIHLIQWMLGSRELPPSMQDLEHFLKRQLVWRDPEMRARRGTAPGAVRGTTYYTEDVEFYPHLSHTPPIRSKSTRPSNSAFLSELRELKPKMYREALKYLAKPDDYSGGGLRDYFEREKSIREGGYVDLYALWTDAIEADPVDPRLGRFIAGPGGRLYEPVIDRPWSSGRSIPSLRLTGTGHQTHLEDFGNPHGRPWHVVDLGYAATFETAWDLASKYDRALRSPRGILYLPKGDASAPGLLSLETGLPVPAEKAGVERLGWNTTRVPSRRHYESGLS